MFKVIATALVLVASVNASAASYYIVDGALKTSGQAQKAALTNPKAQIFKIQATKVSMNEETGRLKKSADLSEAELKSAVSKMK